jgi:hypothetical protein
LREADVSQLSFSIIGAFLWKYLRVEGKYRMVKVGVRGREGLKGVLGKFRGILGKGLGELEGVGSGIGWLAIGVS